MDFASKDELTAYLTKNQNLIYAGQCIWLRLYDNDRGYVYPNQCVSSITAITGNPSQTTARAASTLGVNWYNLTRDTLLKKTDKVVGRVRSPNLLDTYMYTVNTAAYEAVASAVILAGGGYVDRKFANMMLVVGNAIWPPGPDFDAITVGHTVFIRKSRLQDIPLLGHEYIHTLQEENGGLFTVGTYAWNSFWLQSEGSGPRNPNEAIAYLWQGWLGAYQQYRERPPWCFYRPLFGPTPSGC